MADDKNLKYKVVPTSCSCLRTTFPIKDDKDYDVASKKCYSALANHMIQNNMEWYPEGTLAIERYDKDVNGKQEFFFNLDKETNSMFISQWFENPKGATKE